MSSALRLRHPNGEREWRQTPIRVGRAPDNDIVIDEETLSRHHAEIRLEGLQWRIYDLDSANGIWVDGIRRPSHALRSGMQVVLGSVPVDVLGVHGAGKKKMPLRTVLLAAAVTVGSLAVFQMGEDDTPFTEADPRVFEARMPPPPEALTKERAVEAARRFLDDAPRSGAALAEARRAIHWGKQLHAPSVPDEVLQLEERIDELLHIRFQEGRAAYVRAHRLGDDAAAGAALRMLRETFPYDDPRSAEIDRLERMR
jgi:hypothetical protein